MTRRQRLAVLSGAQLACGAAGLALAVRGGHAFDIPGWRGSPESVARDALWMGTALSAPAPMLLAQVAATVSLARRDSVAARRTLGGLGGAMTVGYLIERLVRRRLTPSGWHRLESPIAASGLILSAAMTGTAVRAEHAAAAGAGHGSSTTRRRPAPRERGA